MKKLEDLVKDYKSRFGAETRAERLSFVRELNLKTAISRAALCRNTDGTRHPHQYRIPYVSLQEAKRQLLANQRRIRASESFEQLHTVVEALISGISMIGPLVIYDVATRIGAFLGLTPSVVYLHRGTRQGARALGFSRARKTLLVNELPAELAGLKPHELEDFLCIYKEQLAELSRRPTGSCYGKKMRLPKPCTK